MDRGIVQVLMDRFTGIPIALRIALGVSLLSFLTLYASIVTFQRPMVSYYGAIWPLVLAAGTLLFLPYAFFPIRRRRADMPDPWIWVPIALAVALTVLLSESSLYKSVANDTIAAERLGLYFAVFVFGIGVRVWAARGGRSLVEGTFFTFGLLHAMMLIVALVTIPGLERAIAHSAWPPYHGHVRHLGYHGMVAFCAGIALLYMGGTLRIAGFLWATMAAYGVVFMGSRGAMMAMIVFVFVAVVLVQDRARMVRSVLLVAMVVTAAILVSKLAGFATPIGSDLLSRLGPGTFDGSTSGRFKVWPWIVDAWLARPLLGYGPEGFLTSRCCHAFGTIIQPHNSILQVLLEFGLVGLAALALVWYRAFRGAVRELWRARSSGTDAAEGVLLFSVVMAFMAYSMVDGLHYHLVPLLMFAILCGLFFGWRARWNDGCA